MVVPLVGILSKITAGTYTTPPAIILQAFGYHFKLHLNVCKQQQQQQNKQPTQ